MKMHYFSRGVVVVVVVVLWNRGGQVEGGTLLFF